MSYCRIVPLIHAASASLPVAKKQKAAIVPVRRYLNLTKWVTKNIAPVGRKHDASSVRSGLKQKMSSMQGNFLNHVFFP